MLELFNKGISMLRYGCTLIAYLMISSAFAFAQAPACSQAAAAEAPAPAAGEVVLSVVVNDANGAPVPGAEVRAMGYPDGGKGDYVDRGRARTDAEGKASLRWRPTDTYRSRGFVIARKDGLALGWSSYQAEAGKTARVKLELTKGGILEIAITDSKTHSPIAGATVGVKVAGDLKAFLLNLQKEHAATAPAPNGASTLPAVSSKP